MSKEDENELSRIAEEKMPCMLGFIDKRMQRIAIHSNLRKYGWRVLQTAAVVVLILYIGLTTAVAISGSVRAKVIHFLMEMNDSYMSIGFSENEEEIIVPKEWEGRYYPTYIPQGYFIQHCISKAGANMAEYSDEEGNTIVIKVNGTHTFGRINTENAEIEFIQLHGVEATVLRQPLGDVSIIWSLGDCYFDITGDATTHWRCFLTMTVGLVCGLCVLRLSFPVALSFVSGCASLLLMLHHPLALHPNKAYLEKKRSILVKRSQRALVIQLAILLCLAAAGCEKLCQTFAIALVCSAISRAVVALKRK